MKGATGRWWRRERRALLLLPIALIAVLAASGSRVDEYWWSRGFHEKAEIVDGWAQIEDEYDDGHLTYPIRAELTLDSVRPVEGVPGAAFGTKVAKGGQLWEIKLRWKADPNVSLVGCNLALFDADGVRYDAGPTGWDASSAGLADKCLPVGTAGPRPVLGSTEPPRLSEFEEPRPEAWQSTAYALTKSGAKPVAVRVWYFLPRYVELPVGSSTRG